MRRAACVLALLLGAALVYAQSGFLRPDYVVECSGMADPTGVPTVSVTTASDLRSEFNTKCTAGCIFELAAGTYDDVNLDIGTGDFSGTNDDPNAIVPTGPVLIRGADPDNRPVLRAVVDEQGPILQVMNAGDPDYIRFEHLRLDGRRGDATEAVYTSICADDNSDGICDSGASSSDARGIHTLATGSKEIHTCLYDVEVRETVWQGISLRDTVDSTVEASRVTDVGCAPDTCPNVDVPADASVNSRLSPGSSIVIQANSERTAVIGSYVARATKIGIECFNSGEDCAILDNRVEDVTNSCLTVNGAASALVRGSLCDGSGFFLPHNDSTTNAGFGLSLTSNGSTSARIEGNRFRNIRGRGIQIGASAASATTIELIRNTVELACQDIDTSLQVDFQLGDSTNAFDEIRSILNVAKGGCAVGISVQNVGQAMRSVGDTIEGARGSEAVRIEGSVSGLDMDRPTLGDDLVLDSGATGTLDDCTFTAGTLVDNSGGGVAVSGCP